MKKLSLLLLLMTSVFARENPFVATDSFTEEVARLMEIDEQYSDEFNNKQKKNRTYEDTSSKLLLPEDIEKKRKAKLLLKKEQKEEELRAYELKKKELETKKLNIIQNKEKAKLKAKIKALKLEKMKISMTKKKELENRLALSKVTSNIKRNDNDEIIYVKSRVKELNSSDTTMIKEENTEEELPIENIHNLQALPFIFLTYSNNKMNINTKDYKVFRKLILEDEKKFIFDYKAKRTNFYSKRVNLLSETFKKISIGNHPKEDYFRVVIKVNSSINDYKIETNDSLVTISKK